MNLDLPIAKRTRKYTVFVTGSLHGRTLFHLIGFSMADIGYGKNDQAEVVRRDRRKM